MNKEEVRLAQSLLKAKGHEITYDWTNDDADAGPLDEFMIPENFEIARAIAQRDLNGVRFADLVLFIPPKDGGRGCYTEMGMALALGIPVIVRGPYFNSIFMRLPGVVMVQEPLEVLIDHLASFHASARASLVGSSGFDAEISKIIERSDDTRSALREVILSVISRKGMNSVVSIDVAAHVIHDLFVDLDRTKAMLRQAEAAAHR